MECSFCGRAPTTLRDIVVGRRRQICVSCVADAIHALLAPGKMRDALFDGAGALSCSFCRRSTLSSEPRLRRGAEALAREYPELAIALAPPPWWIP